jgi:hypothetical protein
VSTNPLIGFFYHWIGGLASPTNFIHFRGIKRWFWEIYWLIQGFPAWIIAPVVLAYIFVPNVSGMLHAAPSSSIFYAFRWGSFWGIGGIALGLCTAFGTLIPPVYNGSMHSILPETSGADYYRAPRRPTRDKAEGFGFFRLCCWTYSTIHALEFVSLRGLIHASEVSCRQLEDEQDAR